MKDTGRNTNKIENNKKIVKEKEKSNKKKQNKKNLPTKNFKNFCKRKKKKNDKYEGHAFKPQNQSFVLQCVG